LGCLWPVCVFEKYQFHRFVVVYSVHCGFDLSQSARAEGIQADLDQARLLREEAQGILAEYERKQKEVQEQADRIVEAARAEAASAAAQGKADLQASIERRLAAAEDRITSARAAAEREVRDQAVSVAIAAARGLIAEQMSAAQANKLIDGSIAEVGQKLH
jgi:F-type H+-transporting ATPase subunit b